MILAYTQRNRWHDTSKRPIKSRNLYSSSNGMEISGPKGNITIFDKKVIERHETPCERPTNCTIIDKNYVTSIEGHLLVAETDLDGLLLYPN